MMSQAELLRKADIAVGDLGANGKLNDEQATEFIHKLDISSPLLNASRRVIMRGPTKTVALIGFGSEVMRPGVSGTALTEGNRSKPTITGVDLVTLEGIAEVRIPYDVQEDSIAQPSSIGTHPQGLSGGIADDIMTQLGVRVGRDIGNQALNGDTGGGGSAWLTQRDGWLKQITAQIVDVNGQGISRAVFKSGTQTMPPEFDSNTGGNRHYVARNQEIEYRDNFASRETGRGDAVAEGKTSIAAFGSDIVGDPIMPLASGIYVDPRNFLWGIQRNIFIETDKIITERVYVIVLTLRMDYKIEEVDAVVKYTNIADPT